jgi:hypothetical protein
MKKLLLTFIPLLWVLIVSAQSTNTILFTENGEKFTAILNGVRQNDKPETNVKITGLNAEFYKLKIIFDNKSLGDKNFNLALELGSETSYCIKKNAKGEYVLRFVSTVPLAQAPATSPGQPVIVYHANPVSNTSVPTASTTTTQQTQTTITTTTTEQSNPDQVNMNMGVKVDDSTGSININVSASDGETSPGNTQVLQTTTTTTTIIQGNTATPEVAPAPAILPGYTGPIGCPMPWSASDFEELKQSIKSKSFEDTKMEIAKQVIGQQCLLVTQVKEIIQLFSFEESKLEFAKFAHRHTYDLGNYFKINDVFTFESTIEELNEYIKSE